MKKSKFRRFTALVCAVSLAASSIFYTVSLASPIQLIEKPLRETYATEPKPQPQDGNKPTASASTLQASLPNKAEQINIGLSLLKKSEESQQQHPSSAPEALDAAALDKLELLKGDKSLLAGVNRTKTNIGTIMFGATLANPTSDINTLTQRQQAIKAVAEDEQLTKNLLKKLNSVAHNEAHLLSYYQEAPAATQELINQVYFGSLLGRFNGSSLALELRTRLGNLVDLVQFFFLPTAASLQVAANNKIVTDRAINFGLSYEQEAKNRPEKSPRLYTLTKILGSQFNLKMPPPEQLKEEIIKNLENPLKHNARLFKGISINPTVIKTIKTASTNRQMIEELQKIGYWDHISTGVTKVCKAIAKMYNPFPQAYKDKIPQTRKEAWGSKFPKKVPGNHPQNLGDVLALLYQAPEEVRSSYFPPGASSVKVTAFMIGGLAAIAAFQAWMSKRAYDSAKLKRDITNYIHEKTLAVAHYIDAARKASRIIEKTPALAAVPELQALPQFFNNAQGKLRELFDLLDSSTFKGDQATIISLSGRVLAAHKLIQEIKDQLIPMIIALGHLDVYMSTATLYKEFEGQRVHYAFPTYVSGSAPYVLATNFWNPFVDPKVAVANTIEFGTAEHPNNAILTGPNTGGKTTTIKGIELAILLAQTLGIAPCDGLILTPFAVFNCYLNVTDDLNAGLSLFKAELKRAKELLQKIRSLRPNEFSFTLVDELFSGTSPQEGEHAALQVAAQLARFANSICIIATHYPKMPSLETELATMATSFDPNYHGPLHGFVNYRVTMYKDAQGNWVRPFTIEHGIADVNVALDLLKEEGILQDA